ncbi:Vacuolar membrane protease [Homalodisca vitripennis]|nr:Vacuolar membrane protease [Homalodisca vitripennis]
MMIESDVFNHKDCVVIMCELTNEESSDMEDIHQRVGSQHSNGGTSPIPKPPSISSKRGADRAEQESYVLWRRPVSTLNYFFQELFIYLKSIPPKLWEHRRYVHLSIFIALVVISLNNLAGPHQQVLSWAQKKFLWCVYWFGLGVLSSIGLGTGLHTFLLYLGPHIASVTLAAYECGGLNFPEPPYPDEIICPDEVDPRWVATLWNIMCKVRLEAMMWGAGTAAGELPPYFMARAARLSGYDPEDEDDLREFEEFQRKRELHPESLTLLDRMKVMVESLVEKVGFFGILACASIPNPLFDLAGITCGHFLVPFWTFFGATLIGKAVIKMMIQQIFVIVAFNEALIAKAVDNLSVVPIVGQLLQEPVMKFFIKQKERFHRKGGDSVDFGGNWIAKAFEIFVVSMIIYFIVSIINSFAQSYHKRLRKLKAQKESKD